MYQPISSLNLSAVNDEVKSKVKRFSWKYVEDIDETNLSDEWRDALKIADDVSGYDLYMKQLNQGRISSGVQQLDEVLGGGFKDAQINEFTGDTGSGKTQLCFKICVNLLLAQRDNEVLYINTNRNFNVERLKEITSDHSILSRLFVIDVYDLTEFQATIKHLQYFLPNKKIKLIIIDSIFMPFKILDLKQRKYVMYSLLNELQNLAAAHQVTVVVTNNLSTGEKQSYLGDNFYHRINTRILLSKHFNNYTAKVLKGAVSWKNFARFTIQ